MITDNAFFVSENANTKTDKYIGRFAPSPTGPLHFGSLIAATASYLNAKNHPNNQWLLRIEDVDTQRIQKGATSDIINTLEAYGFKWDGDITYQSQRSHIYAEALTSIEKSIYLCSCTRKSLMAAGESYSYIYPGLCRKGAINKDRKNHSVRVVTNEDAICFTDECQPDKFCQNINKEVGDFNLKRSDGLWSYQLAVVVDDALQGVTDVVRGADLFDNTPRQIFLQRLFDYPQPNYFHFPVAVNTNGKKLSKQNQSPAVSIHKKIATLIEVLRFLGQTTPDAKEFASLDDLWLFAVQNWNPSMIPSVFTLPYKA